MSDLLRPLAALAVLALLPPLMGCGKGLPPACSGEEEQIRAGGLLPALPESAVADPTAGGALSGVLGERELPRKVILLLDYSGSMYGGYGKAQVAGCNRCVAGLAAGRSLRHVAGWTQPYYVATPEFQAFLARWLDAATPAGGDLSLEILLFNDRVFRLAESGVEPFPPGSALRFERRVSRADTAEITAWLQQIPTDPYAVDPQAPNSTDSRAALRTALETVRGDEAIVWLITDNIVDTEGGALADPDARLTTEFYRELEAEPRVQMISAYPLFHAEPCSWMCGTSLFAYGIYASYFARPSSARFHRIGGTAADGDEPSAGGLLWNSALQELAAQHSGRSAQVERGDLAGVPVRLKPIDTEALALGFGRPALRCDPAEFGQKMRCQARLEVRNALRHQTVESAELRLSNELLLPRKRHDRSPLPWASAVCAGQLKTLDWQVKGGPRGRSQGPIEIGRLAPLAKVVVDVGFELPPVAVAGGRRAALFDVAFTNEIVLEGPIRAEIRDFRTALSIDPERFAFVYGSAQLPAIFRKGEVGSAGTVYRIDAVLANNGQALAWLALLGFGGGGALAGLVAMRFRRKQYTLVVDGAETRLSLPRWSRHQVEIDGTARATLRRNWGPDYKLVPRRGARLRRQGSEWLLRLGDDIGEEHRIEVRPGWPHKPRPLVGDRMENW